MRKLTLCCCVFACMTALTQVSTARTRNDRQVVQNRMPAMVRKMGLSPVRRMDTTTTMNLAIGLPLRNQAKLKTLIQNLYDPSSPDYHKFLSPAQFTAEFGPTEQDYQKVIDYARSEGLKVTHKYFNRLLVGVSARVPRVEKAFHLHMFMYRHPHKKTLFFAPDSEPTVANGLKILDVVGLSNYTRPRPMDLTEEKKTQASPMTNGSAFPITGDYWGTDFRNAYAPTVSLDGQGQKVGLLELDGYNASDIDYYAKYTGPTQLPAPHLSNWKLDGATGLPVDQDGYAGENIEVCLDIDMVLSMAPDLDSIVVFMSGSAYSALEAMAKDNSVKQLSCSWTFTGDASTNEIIIEFAAQGQSFFCASGDEGADRLRYPSDDPYLTSVGGTDLTTTTSHVYSSETVWNGSGGGPSPSFGLPSYQAGIATSTNQASTTMRNVPDVAMVAHDIYVYCHTLDKNSSGQYVYVNDHNQSGTSCAAPLWAGLMALVNQQRASAGKASIGFLNPILYSIARSSDYSNDFHDVTTGSNAWSGSNGNYNAAPGYDLCTGWGTPKSQNLMNALTNTTTVISGDVTFTSTYTVPSGENLVIKPSSNVTFSSGGRLVIYGIVTVGFGAVLNFSYSSALYVESGGQLYILGTSQNPVTLTGSTGQWGGIQVGSSGAADLHSCDFNQTNIADGGDLSLSGTYPLGSNLSVSLSSGGKLTLTGTYTLGSNLNVSLSSGGKLTLNGTLNTSGQTFTVPAGATLAIDPGSSINLSNGAAISCEGLLEANGTGSNLVTINGGPTILDGSGASGSTLNYVQAPLDINGFSIEVENTSNIEINHLQANSVYFFNSTGTVQNSALYNDYSSNGTRLEAIEGCTVNCYDNTILDEKAGQGDIGICYMDGSAGNIGGNTVTSLAYGMSILDGSSPHFHNPSSTGGNNLVFKCSTSGLDITNYSYPVVGYNGSDCMGANAIYDNSGEDITMSGEGTFELNAVGTYWNNGNPADAKFSLASGSSVDQSLPLSTNPCASRVKQQKANGPAIYSAAGRATLQVEGVTPPSASESADPLSNGYQLQQQGKFGQAKDFFVSYLSKHPNCQPAYSDLYDCADSETTPGLITYFQNLPKEASKGQRLLLSYLYMKEKSYTSALENDDSIIARNGNTELSELALLNKFYIALNVDNNTQLASSILTDATKDDGVFANQAQGDPSAGAPSTPIQIVEARIALANYVNPNTGTNSLSVSGSGQKKDTVSQAPKETLLMPNYPNPFNPTTVIRYQLSKATHVTIRVYDVLGQQVATLVDGEQSAGYHQVTFNGSDLASGVYFYRISTPAYSKVMKMLMVK